MSTAPAKPVTIHQIGHGARASEWIAIPKIVHADDPVFIAQLDLKERMRLSRWFNPFFAFGEAAFFVARRDGRPVGRISAQINRMHRETQDPQSGHFGFFDCLDDPEAAGALFDAARNWLRARGATSISGPFSLSINEESGLLVEGFDTPAAMLMDQSRPYTGSLVEGAGLSKAMDTFAFRILGHEDNSALNRIATAAEASPRVKLRPIRMEQFEQDVRLVIDIFNDAWRANWEFVPFTEGEIISLVRELKPFYRPEYGRFVELDGEPIAFLMVIPDINGITASYKGRLFPLNWWHMIRTLRRGTFRSVRVPLMGIRQAHQRSMLAAGMLALLAREFLRQKETYTLDWVEFSWVLEGNRAMLAFANILAGKPVKRYRFYKGPITPAQAGSEISTT